MKKTVLYAVLGLTVVAVAAALAAPKVIGSGVREATTRGLLELLPPESRTELQITETRFDNGWFSSTAELDVRYAVLADQEDLALRLQFDIQHGPLLFTPGGPRLGLAYAEIVPAFNSAELNQAMADIPFDLPEMRIDLLANLDQTLQLNLTMEPFNYGDESGQISFAGMNGNLTTYPDLSAKVLFSMGELLAEQPSTQMRISVAGVNLQSNTEKMNDLLAPSMAMLVIPAISSSAPIPFNISNISADSRLQRSVAGPAQIDFHQGFRIASIEADMPVESMNLMLDFNEVHTDLIRSYYRMMEAIQAAMSSSPQATTDSLDEYTEEITLVLVQNSLVFGTQLEANAFAGDHKLDLRIDWRGMPDTTDLNSIEALQILDVLNLDLNLSLDAAAISRSPLADLVDPYVQQGYLRIDNGRILMDMNLSDAELTVNGETVSLEQFL